MLNSTDLKTIRVIVKEETEPKFLSIEKILKSMKKDIRDILKFVKFFDSSHFYHFKNFTLI